MGIARSNTSSGLFPAIGVPAIGVPAIGVFVVSVLAVGVLAASACILSSCDLKQRAATPNSPRLFLRYAEERTADYPAAAAGREFAKNCERRTLGAIQVQIYDAGKLGTEASVVEQLRFGGIDLARVSVRALTDLSPTASRLGLPGAVASEAEARALMAGKAGADIAAELLAQKIVVLAWFDAGPECRLVPADATGDESGPYRVGLESSRGLMDLIVADGLTPIPMALRDFRHARDTGLADSFILPLLAAESEHLLDGLRPIPTPDSRILEFMLASRAIFQKILPKDRETILEAARETQDFHALFRSAAESRLLTRLKA